MSAVIFEDRGVRKGGGGPKLTTVNSVAVVGGAAAAGDTQSAQFFAVLAQSFIGVLTTERSRPSEPKIIISCRT